MSAVSHYFPQRIETRDLVSYNQTAFFTQALYAASLPLFSQLSLNSNLVGSFTLGRRDRGSAEAALFRLRLWLRRDRVVAKTEGLAPTNRQLLNAPG